MNARQFILVSMAVALCMTAMLCRAACGEKIWLSVDATSPWLVTATPRYVGGTVIVYDWSITWSIVSCREYHDPPGWSNKYFVDVIDQAAYLWNPGGSTERVMTRTGTTLEDVVISSSVTATYNGRSDNDSEWTFVNCGAPSGGAGAPIIIEPAPGPAPRTAG
ncbi:MAG: hypothetical protein N2595_07780 [bacterium]|nr:hypothetical protein [bacterium]